MGLFSFIRTAGESLGILEAEQEHESTTKADQAAAAAEDFYSKMSVKLEAYLGGLGIEISGLDVIYKKGGFTRIFGTVNTTAEREKVLLALGGVKAVTEVDDNMKVLHPEPEAQFHTVVPGDTLSKLAQTFYGNMKLYNVIFEANRPPLLHPDRIYPGQILRVPPLGHTTHTVQRGETLGAIAKHYYGDAMKYQAIFEANRDVLTDPNVVSAGQVLRLPEA